jgi:hypothetical protein
MPREGDLMYRPKETYNLHPSNDMPKSSYNIYAFSYFAMHVVMVDLFELW